MVVSKGFGIFNPAIFGAKDVIFVDSFVVELLPVSSGSLVDDKLEAKKQMHNLLIRHIQLVTVQPFVKLLQLYIDLCLALWYSSLWKAS